MVDNINLKIWDQEYEVKFPLTYQLIDITDMRSKLSGGNYEIFKSLGEDGIIATCIVDTVAHFNVLIPTLKNRLNVNGLIELPLEKIIELCWVYTDQFKPWYDNIMSILSMKKEPKIEEYKKEKVE